MALIDVNSLRKSYKIYTNCTNCGHRQESNVPKGTTVKDFIASQISKCSNCGCTTLEIHFPNNKNEKPKEAKDTPKAIVPNQGAHKEIRFWGEQSHIPKDKEKGGQYGKN